MYLRVNPTAPLSFSNGFTVTKDWSSTQFADGGGDTFDGWGNFTLDGQSIPILNSVMNAANGVWNTNQRNGFQPVAFNLGWLSEGLLAIEFIWNGTRTLGWSGNLGSDGGTQSGTVSSTVTIGGQPVLLATTWSNDGGQDATGGDPQVTRTVVPLLASEAAAQRYSVSFAGDQETGASSALAGGVIFFLQWGAATVAQVQAAITSALSFSTDPLPALVDPTVRLSVSDIRLPPRSWAPVGFRITTQALRYDSAFGGKFVLSGYTEIDGTPPTRVGPRRVLVLDQRSGRLVRETWSDAAGWWEVRDLADVPYLIVSPDSTLTYDPAALSDQRPDPMP